MNELLIETLQKAAGEQQVKINEPMSSHITFRVGGAADIFVDITGEQALSDCVKACNAQNAPWYLIGNGSNLLVGDQGCRQVILHIGKEFGAIRIEGEEIEVEAGALLVTLAKAAAEQSLGGLEFASGIPGSLGGGIYMNAGAYGGEMKDVVKSVRVMNREGEIFTLSGEEMDFGYRTSRAAKEGLIVLSARLILQHRDKQAIMDEMAALRQKRVEKQPLDKPSAGSTFKRPEGYFAGKLIMDAGLAGYRVGGAMVSPKHCGFVVNDGGATAKDVLTLIEDVQAKVAQEFQVKLEPEVKMLGEF